MTSLRAINRKAKQVAENCQGGKGGFVGAAKWAVFERSRQGLPPHGCTLNFTPGWEVDISGGTAGLCQPVERDLFDCYLGCGWPGHVPDHLTNAPNWTDKCASAVNDWRNVDIVFP